MKYILLFTLPFLFFLACKKDKDRDMGHSFNIHGIADIYLEPGDLRILELQIEHVEGAQKNVSLEISGMPQGVTAKFNTSSGIPDFATVLTITTSDEVTAGVYQLVISCSDGAVNKEYQFDLHIRDCLKKLVGNKTGMNVCPSGGFPYDAEVMWMSGLDSRIYIVGFGGFSSVFVYADIDCETGMVTLPRQLIDDYYYGGRYEIWGNGTFSNGKIEVTYTYADSEDSQNSETCTTVLE